RAVHAQASGGPVADRTRRLPHPRLGGELGQRCGHRPLRREAPHPAELLLETVVSHARALGLPAPSGVPPAVRAGPHRGSRAAGLNNAPTLAASTGRLTAIGPWSATL